MADINTTSINDIPTDPGAGGSIGGNVNLVINETTPSSNTMSLDQSTISQIVNGLQQASLAGATSLPSRDIPLNTEQLTKDVEVQPNYIPAPQMRDYINETDEDINNYYRSEKMENSLDSVYDELQNFNGLLFVCALFGFIYYSLSKTVKHFSKF